MNGGIDMPKRKNQLKYSKSKMIIYHGVQQTTKAPGEKQKGMSQSKRMPDIPRMKVIVRRAFRARFWYFDFLRLVVLWFCKSSRRLDLAELVPVVTEPVPSFGTDIRPFSFCSGVIFFGQFDRSLISICAITHWSFVFGNDILEFCVTKLSKVTFDAIRLFNGDKPVSCKNVSEWCFFRIGQSSDCL